MGSDDNHNPIGIQEVKYGGAAGAPFSRFSFRGGACIQNHWSKHWQLYENFALIKLTVGNIWIQISKYVMNDDRCDC